MSTILIKIERCDDDCEVVIETSYGLYTDNQRKEVQDMANEITQLYITHVIGRPNNHASYWEAK